MAIKVLHVEAGKHLYGGAQQVVYLLACLHANNQNSDTQPHIENILACPTGSDIAKAAAPYAKIIEMDMKGDADIGMAWRLKKIIKTENVNLLHLHSRRGADIWGALAAKLAGCKVLLTRRVDNAEPTWFAKRKYHWFDHVAAISEGIRQVLLSEQVNPEHVTTVRSAVDLAAFKPTPDPEWFANTFNLKPEHFVIAVVAQLIERKGHQLLFNVLPQLRQKYPHLRVVILGKGPLRAQLEAEIERLHLTDIVQFAGFRNDMPRLLPNFNLVVHPAYIEGLGVSLLQASACGVPVVSCRTGGIPEAVAHNEHGLLVNPGDSEGLYHAISDIICDPELHQRFKRRGIERMNQEFAIEAMAAGNVALYQRILGLNEPT